MIPWREEEMVLAVHPSHRLAGLGEVDAGQLDGETFVGFEAGLPIRRAVDRFLRKHGVHVRVSLEFDNIETIKRAVEVPSGVAILPAPTVVGEVNSGTLCCVRFKDRRPTRPLAIIHRRSEQLGLGASRFLELLTLAEGPAAHRNLPKARPFASDAAETRRRRASLKVAAGPVRPRDRWLDVNRPPRGCPEAGSCRIESPRRVAVEG